MLRVMEASDLDVVCALDRAAYAHPWSAAIFRDCLRFGYDCWVGEIERGVVAHAVTAIAAGECHLLNLCVHPSWQGRGLGRAILRHLLDTARAREVDTVFLEVRASNTRARALYHSEGFGEIGIRRGYYPADQGREDAVTLARVL